MYQNEVGKMTGDSEGGYLTLISEGSGSGHFEERCELCSRQQHVHPASSYCRTCGVYLCHSCYTVHLLPQAQRLHSLVDLRNLPDTCRDLSNTLENIQYTASEALSQFKSTHQKVSQCNIDAVKAFKDFKKQVIENLENSEAVLVAQVKANDEDNARKLQKVFVKCEPVTEEAGKILTKVKSLYPAREKYNLPDVVKAAQSRVPDLQSAVKDAMAAGSLCQVSFQPHSHLLAQLNSLEQLGQVIHENIDVAIQPRTQPASCPRDSGYSSYNTIDSDYHRPIEKQQSLTQPPQKIHDIKSMKPPPLPNRDGLPRNASCSSQMSAHSEIRYVASPVGRGLEDQASGGTTASMRSTHEDQLSLKSAGSKGSVKSGYSDVTSNLQNIVVKSKDDKRVACISSMISLDMESLVAADFANKKVKLINSQRCCLEACFKTGSGPWDLTLVKDNTMAVTVPKEKKILLLHCKHDLRGGRTLIKEGGISVRGYCRGIVYTNITGCLIVTYAPYKQLGGVTKIEIIDLTGCVKHLISLGQTGGTLSLSNPVYIVTNRDQDKLYVSDQESVSCLALDGSIVASYTDPQLKEPYQVASGPDDTIYVCGIKSRNVHKISSSCRKLGITLSDGLKAPISICYCFGTGKMVVGMQESDEIKVYHLGNSW